MRALLGVVDTEATAGGPVDEVKLKDVDTGAVLAGGMGGRLIGRQRKLKDGSACDVCKILEPGQGPEAIVTVHPGKINALTREPEPLRGWHVLFNKDICQDFARIGELAVTMIHEATHACPSAGGGAIYDLSPDSPGVLPGLTPLSPNGCTAYDIGRTCKGG
jgi:hypothetical protein